MKENRIKELREEQGLSQSELARRARIGPTNLNAIEHGRIYAWPKARRSLAKALKVTQKELFPEEA